MLLDIDALKDFDVSDEEFWLTVPGLVEDKIFTVLNYQNYEIAWYGIIEPTRDNRFHLRDIKIFPQTVTGVTVETDEIKFAKWLGQLPDKDYSMMKLHCHSHVQMDVKPSTTDLKYYQSQVEGMDDDDYKIFVIMNQWMEFDGILVDKKNKTVYPNMKYEVHVDSQSAIGGIYQNVTVLEPKGGAVIESA